MSEKAVRELREAVTRFSGIQDQNAPARPRQLKSGRQACKAASNNDYVVTHGNQDVGSGTVLLAIICDGDLEISRSLQAGIAVPVAPPLAGYHIHQPLLANPSLSTADFRVVASLDRKRLGGR